nr:MAG TPA: hypothetical protein [Caudoviricetes sp.]
MGSVQVFCLTGGLARLVLLFHPSMMLWWTHGLCLDYPM